MAFQKQNLKYIKYLQCDIFNNYKTKYVQLPTVGLLSGMTALSLMYSAL